MKYANTQRNRNCSLDNSCHAIVDLPPFPFDDAVDFLGACGDGALLASSLDVPVPLDEEKRACCRFTYQLGDRLNACLFVSNRFAF